MPIANYFITAFAAQQTLTILHSQTGKYRPSPRLS